MSEEQVQGIPHPEKHHTILIEKPPTGIGGILRRLGPGLIIAGSIVGSGELIATTKTGAEAGFWLLWLILLGCVIKVFVQVEFGRYTLTTGRTAMDGMDEVPGPRLAGRGNWLVWYWMLVFVSSLGQLGGIVGGVGQALSITAPLTQDGRDFNDQVIDETQLTVARAELELAKKREERGDARFDQRRLEQLQQFVSTSAPGIVERRLKIAREQLAAAQQNAERGVAGAAEKAARLGADIKGVEARIAEQGTLSADIFGNHVPKEFGHRRTYDAELWAALITVVTAIVLVIGHYGFIQSFSTLLVGTFTLLTVVNLFMLQANDAWAVTGADLINGMSFRLSDPKLAATVNSTGMSAGLATALATFGIIGVGANELISYPYWCLEKGYARFTGPRNDTQEWADRASGWMRVMRWDAWCSMVVYTFATLAFYLLGAAILGRTGLNPGGDDMIITLGVMYEPVFGALAKWIFLFGAFAVLYSTFFVANASHARVFPDALRIFGVVPSDDASYRRWIRIFSGIFPFGCLLFFVVFKAPAQLVLISGLMQAIMLPMLAVASLYFRYRRVDSRILPGKAWDAFLWLSAFGMLITGSWAVWSKIAPMVITSPKETTPPAATAPETPGQPSPSGESDGNATPNVDEE